MTIKDASDFEIASERIWEDLRRSWNPTRRLEKWQAFARSRAMNMNIAENLRGLTRAERSQLHNTVHDLSIEAGEWEIIRFTLNEMGKTINIKKRLYLVPRGFARDILLVSFVTAATVLVLRYA